MEVDPLQLFASRDRIGLAGEVGLERLAAAHQVEPAVVELGGLVAGDAPELLARRVVVLERDLGLGVSQRHLLAAELDPRGQHRVLQLVVGGRELERHDAVLARLAQRASPARPASPVPARRTARA